MIKDQSLTEFLDNLASAASTPGGGSAAAILGAMGAALTSMVCNLTIGKKGYEAVSADLEKVLADAEAVRHQLIDMIQDDVNAFDGVMGAYGMPKETDEQKAARSAHIQEALKTATAVPLACARACQQALVLSGPAAEMGNKNVISDAGVAVMAAYAGLMSAALNVYINVGAIKDAEFADEHAQGIADLLANAQSETDRIYDLVKSKL